HAGRRWICLFYLKNLRRNQGGADRHTQPGDFPDSLHSDRQIVVECNTFRRLWSARHRVILNSVTPMILRLQHIVIAGLLFPGLVAAANEASYFAPRVEQWGVQELSLRSQRNYGNPFTDVTLQGRFRSQGKDIT